MSLSTLPTSGRAYIALVAILGMGALAHAIYSLFVQPIGSNWFVLAALTLVTGSATVKLPSVPATISISETFVFTATLLYGPAAGTLTVALDALVISYSLARKGHPAYRLLFNVCALPASLWVGAHLFFWVANIPPLAFVGPDQKITLAELIEPLIVFTTAYFGLNSWLIAIAISIERKVAATQVWRENFAWLALNYFGGASVAALLVTYTREIDYAFIAIVVPLLAVLYFTFSTALGRIEDTNKHLTKLNTLYMSTIETLAMAIDAKDQITHGHIRRVQHYAVELARRVGITDKAQINAIEAASLLHDMGKLAVPEYILNKPGPLSPAEFDKMKLHASVGADILSAIDFPYPVVPIVRHHHENWDGSGYPAGLKMTDIPIGARILAVVDCFDALTSDRPYRPRLPDEEAIQILVQRRGSMYDPVVVDTFIASHAELSAGVSIQPVSEDQQLAAITRTIMRFEIDTSQVSDRFNEINASAEETLILFELSRIITGLTEFEAIAERACTQLRRLVPATTYVVYKFEDSSDELIAFAFGQHSAQFLGLRVGRGQRLSGWVAANLQPVVNSDPVLELGEGSRALRPPLRSYLGVPILNGKTLVGVLAIYSQDAQAFSDDHLRVVEAVARQIGPALFLKGNPVERSQTSPQLPSLEQLERFLSAQIAAANLNPTSIVEVAFPVEKQLRLNSSIESVIALAVRQALGPTDFLFQNWPSSLVCVLTGADHHVAEKVSSDIRDYLRSLGAALGLGTISVVVGCATAPDDGLSIHALRAKARGPSRSPGSSSSIH